MATQTSHYSLTKPEMSDAISADIPALAANFETIDAQLYNANSKTGVPSGGTTGQVLTKTPNSIGWQDASGIVTVDSALNASSENPVQNKVIAAALGDIESILATVVTV